AELNMTARDTCKQLHEVVCGADRTSQCGELTGHHSILCGADRTSQYVELIGRCSMWS
ncbi:hypothetical protein RRG08_067181, partial [Elysia crispata]